MTSELTILEVLTKPLKTSDVTLESALRKALYASPDVRLAPISQAVLERAAAIRATHNLKTPDAIHAATALIEGCAVFVTNDPTFRRVSGMTVILLDDLMAP